MFKNIICFSGSLAHISLDYHHLDSPIKHRKAVRLIACTAFFIFYNYTKI